MKKLSRLGRCLVAATLACATQAFASDSVFIFGDSLSDSGNNARDTLEAIGAGAPLLKTLFSGTRSDVADVGYRVDQLQAAGARNIVVWNTPDIAKTPAVMAETGGSLLAGIVVKSMNRALDRRLANEVGVTEFDVFGLFGGVIANPGPYGLLNVTDACGGMPGCDPSTSLFWDGIHPTSAGHQIIADAMTAQVGAVPEPETLWLFSFGGIALLLLRRRA